MQTTLGSSPYFPTMYVPTKGIFEPLRDSRSKIPFDAEPRPYLALFRNSNVDKIVIMHF